MSIHIYAKAELKQNHRLNEGRYAAIIAARPPLMDSTRTEVGG